MVKETKFQNLSKPVTGQTQDWGEVLNQATDSIDEKLIIRDTLANQNNYPPDDDVIFYATDEETLYIGDGNSWNEQLAFSPEVAKQKGFCVGVTVDGSTTINAVASSGSMADIETVYNFVENNGGGTVYLPEQDQAGNRPVVVTDGITDIPSNKIRFKGGSLESQIPEPADPSIREDIQPVFEFGRQLTESPDVETSLASNADAGQKQLVVSDSTGMQVGDLVAVQTDDLLLLNNTGDSREMGESAIIEDIDSGTDTLTLNRSLRESYTTGGGVNTVVAWRPCEVVFEDVEITAPRGDYIDYSDGVRRRHIKLTHVIDTEVRNCNLIGGTDANVLVRGGYNVSIDNNDIAYASYSHPTNGSTGYGISFTGALVDGSAQNNHVQECRHDIAHSSSPGTYGVPMTTVNNNRLVAGETNHIADAHAACYESIWRDNSIEAEDGNGGLPPKAIVAGSYHTDISNNTIRGCRGISNRGTTSGGTYHAKNNTFIDCTEGVVLDETGRVLESVIIQGNSGTGCQGDNGWINLGELTSTGEAVVRDNEFVAAEDDLVNYWVIWDEASGTEGQFIDISGNTFSGQFDLIGINLIDLGDGTEDLRGVVRNNRFLNAEGNWCVQLRDASGIDVSENTFKGADGTVNAIREDPLNDGNNPDYNTFEGNVFFNVGTELTITGTNSVNVGRNRIFPNTSV